MYVMYIIVCGFRLVWFSSAISQPAHKCNYRATFRFVFGMSELSELKENECTLWIFDLCFTCLFALWEI